MEKQEPQRHDNSSLLIALDVSRRDALSEYRPETLPPPPFATRHFPKTARAWWPAFERHAPLVIGSVTAAALFPVMRGLLTASFAAAVTATVASRYCRLRGALHGLRRAGEISSGDAPREAFERQRGRNAAAELLLYGASLLALYASGTMIVLGFRDMEPPSTLLRGYAMLAFGAALRLQAMQQAGVKDGFAMAADAARKTGFTPLIPHGRVESRPDGIDRPPPGGTGAATKKVPGRNM